MNRKAANLIVGIGAALAAGAIYYALAFGVMSTLRAGVESAQRYALTASSSTTIESGIEPKS